MTTDQPCRICGNSEGNRTHLAREMMFGSREPFPYVECGSCGCVQLAEIPPDLARHYPRDYYSLHDWTTRSVGPLKRRLRRARALHRLGSPSAVGWFLTRLSRPRPRLRWLEVAGAGPGSSILDVGCGSGALLGKLHADGFSHLTGVDPHAPELARLPRGLRVVRAELHELRETFDLVMMHHSLEHIPDQAGAMRALRRVVAPGGTALVRIPLAGTWAWRTYGVDWVQLDAPRHLYLHTGRSFRRLAEEAGFVVHAVEHDSGAFQLWGSEQYRAGVPLTDPRSRWVNRRSELFTRRQLAGFRARAAALNAAGDGDQACFYLRPR